MTAPANKCALCDRWIFGLTKGATCRECSGGDPEFDRLHNIERRFRKQRRKEKGKP